MITLAMVLMLIPPKIYDYEPKVHYDIRQFHEHREPILLEVFCKAPGRILLGCAIGNHIIYIRDDLHDQVYDIILRHEKAHLNGWRHK